MEDFGLDDQFDFEAFNIEGKSVVQVEKLRSPSVYMHWGYCGNKKFNGYRRRKWGFKSTMMSTDHYEYLIEKNYIRNGSSSYARAEVNDWWCRVFQPRVIVDDFKISKQQKKHMKRFNQFINGTRDFPPEPEDVRELRDKFMYGLPNYNILYKQEQNNLIRIFRNVITEFKQIEQEQIGEGLERMRYFDAKIKIMKNDNDGTAFFRTDCKSCLEKWGYNETEISIFNSLLQSCLEESKKYKIIEDNNEEGNIDIEVIKAKNMDDIKTRAREWKKELEIKKMKSGNFLSLKSMVLSCQQEQEESTEDFANLHEISLDISRARSYTEYFDEFWPNTTPESERKHRYAVSIHPAVVTQESYELYRLFYGYTFGYDTTIPHYQDFLCLSSLVDPRLLSKASPTQNIYTIDDNKEFKDLGVCPEYYGTYHIYHRIDDILFAVTVVDFTPNYLLSAFCFYDPRYKFLSPGAVTGVREIELLKKWNKEHGKDIKYYGMYDVVLDCPKVEYKLHMHPTQLLCPISLKFVLLTEDVKKRINEEIFITLDPDEKPYEKMPLEDSLNIVKKKSYIDFNGYSRPIQNALNQDGLGVLAEIYRDLHDKFDEIFYLIDMSTADVFG